MRTNRQIIQGFIFHSDRGIQYASKEFTAILKQNLFITQSMSRKANCWDNAVAESFFSCIKRELINHELFYNTQQLQQQIFEYIQWYNNKRIHQSLNYKTPNEVEQFLLTNFTKVA